MGYVKVRALISDPARKNSKEVEFLADSGAGYMVIPPSLANELGLDKVAEMLNLPKVRLTLADKREVEVSQTVTMVRMMNREAPVTAVIVDCPMPLLGAFTLQVLGLQVDPSTEQIKPSRPFSLGIM